MIVKTSTKIMKYKSEVVKSNLVDTLIGIKRRQKSFSYTLDEQSKYLKRKFLEVAKKELFFLRI